MGNKGVRFSLACALLAGAACPDPRMVLIPGGDYVPPFQDSGAREKVRVAPFWMDVLPVTIGEYLEFVRKHPDWRKSRVKRIFADSSYLAAWTGDLEPPAGDLSAPATGISWYAAKDFCASREKRLPGTREWERAARALPPGMDSAAYADRILAWYGQPSSGTGSTQQGSINAFGVRDLFGKVWEWTSDFNSEGLVRAAEYGEKNKSLFCGGAGTAAASRLDYATYMRFAFRSCLKPEFSTQSLGFRCVGEPR